MNFLEQLISEWYEYSGYFVRSNVKALKRAKGGWDAELDILAYDPNSGTLLHVETSGDSNSWEERKHRFLTKKFMLTRGEYEEILGCRVSNVKKIAVVGYSHFTKKDLDWGNDIEVVLIPNLVRQIAEKLRSQKPMQEAVPEGFPILRTVPMFLAYGI